MAESMKDYEKELEESMKTIEEGDILTGIKRHLLREYHLKQCR